MTAVKKNDRLGWGLFYPGENAFFFEKFCSDNRNSGLLKVFNIRLGLEFVLPMSGLSRIPD